MQFTNVRDIGYTIICIKSQTCSFIRSKYVVVDFVHSSYN